MKINKSELFKTAWKMAKDAADKFGDSVRTFFSESLRQAWKNLSRIDINKLKEKGSEWIRGNNHRIYFNNIKNLLGLKIEKIRGCYYINGKVAEYFKEARNLDNRLWSAKFYYDCIKKEFFGKGLTDSEFQTLISKFSN